MVNSKHMAKIFKIFVISLLTVCLSVATVICCCVAPAVISHFHKVSGCSHCHDQNSAGSSSTAAGSCQSHITVADASHSQTITSSAAASVFLPVQITFDKYTISLLPSSVVSYPRGSPPLGASLVPLYLRTFSLRI